MQTPVTEPSQATVLAAVDSGPTRLANRRERLGIGAFGAFIGLYLISFLFLVVNGYADAAALTLRYAITFGTLSAVTYFLTIPATKAYQPGPQPSALQRPLTRAHFAGLAVCFVAVLVSGWLQTRMNPSVRGSSLWSLQSLVHFGVAAFTIEVVLVFLTLRALRVPARVLGLAAWAKGSSRVAVAWIGLALLYVVIDSLTGKTRVQNTLGLIVRNIFQNGFSEEFLFRGALLSRLRTFVRLEWALLGQALVFGAWHYGADIRSAGGNVLVAIAFMITVQSVFGYALGFLAVRTRSIAITATFHALADATSII